MINEKIQGSFSLFRAVFGTGDIQHFPIRKLDLKALVDSSNDLVDLQIISRLDDLQNSLEIRVVLVNHNNHTPLGYYTQYIRHSQSVEHDKLIAVIRMISYKPFYETLYKKDVTEYNLIYKQGFSANTLYRIKKGKPISTKTLDALCDVLDCRVEDIICFVKE